MAETVKADFYEERARNAKCRKIVAYLIEHMAKMMANPDNAEFWIDAARQAGVPELSYESKELALGMLDQLAGRLKRETN